MTREYMYKLVHDAYIRARRGKKKKIEVHEFMQQDERLLGILTDELIAETYRIDKATRFFVMDPVVREIFALSFRDRIVQHVVHGLINPLFEKQFIYDSYAARRGKGTLFAVDRVDHMMRSCSKNYQEDARVLKLDIKSFFLSINKHILRDLIRPRVMRAKFDDIHTQRVLDILYQLLFHDPTVEYVNIPAPELEAGYPKHKSLLYAEKDIGLPLGNLLSQLCANVYLHELDMFVKHTLRCKRYGRYMDDFALFADQKETLLTYKHRISDFVGSKLYLQLHPDKVYIQQIKKGLMFCGVVIQPRRRTLRKRTIGNWKRKINQNQDSEYVQQMMASYDGLAKHHDMYRLREFMASY